MDEFFLNFVDNRKKLESCSMHDFSIDLTPLKPNNKVFRCSNCGAKVEYLYKYFYEQGLRHKEKTYNDYKALKQETHNAACLIREIQGLFESSKIEQKLSSCAKKLFKILNTEGDNENGSSK